MTPIFGKVVNGDNGLNLADVAIYQYSEGDRLCLGKSNANGDFYITVLPGRELYPLSFCKNGFTTVCADPADIDQGIVQMGADLGEAPAAAESFPWLRWLLIAGVALILLTQKKKPQ